MDAGYQALALFEIRSTNVLLVGWCSCPSEALKFTEEEKWYVVRYLIKPCNEVQALERLLLGMMSPR